MFSTLMLCTVFFILGVVISPSVSLSNLVLLAFCVVLALIFTRKKLDIDISKVILAAVMLILGGLRYTTDINNSVYNRFPDKYIHAEGVISSIPQPSSGKNKYRYELELDKITYLEHSYKTSSKILLYTSESYAFGDTVTAEGFLYDLREPGNEFAFNEKLYYKSIGIEARLIALKIEKTGRKSSLSPVFLSGLMKYRIYKNAMAAFDGRDSAYIIAIMTGNKNYFDSDYKNLLLKTGVSRVLYSPFLHIAFIMLLAGFFFASRSRRDMLAIILILFYLIFWNSSPRAMKTGIIIGASICLKKLKGYSNKWDILSFCVLLFTAANPMLCFNGGFMISVICSAIIYLSYKPVYNRLIKVSVIRKLRLAAPLTLWTVLSFGIMPYLAYYSNGIPLYGTFMTPLLSPVVITVFLMSPFVCIGGAALKAVLPILKVCTSVLGAVPYVIGKLPLYYVMLPTPSLTVIAICILCWWIFLRILNSKLKTPATKALISAALGLTVCCVIETGINSLNIYFVNVGHGDAAVLHTFWGETAIIDGGGAPQQTDTYNVGESVFLPYLISHGFTDIDVAVLSHYHKDHAEGIIAAAENLRIKTLILPDCMPENEYRRRLSEIADEKKIRIEYVHPGDKIKFRSGLVFTVLAPYPDRYEENENNTSLVIKVDYGKFTALFAGDYENEETLTPPENISLYKVSHHGSEDANSADFINSLKPEISVISVDGRDRYGLPDRETVDRLEAAGSTVLRTDKLGDIRIRVSKNGHMRYNSLWGGAYLEQKK